MSRVLVIYQAFPPDPAAGGQCVADVCATLARRGTTVRVLAADRGYNDPSERFAARERMQGFDVRRVGFASFGKSSLLRRLAGGILFVVGAVARGVMGARPDVVLAGNSPPIGALAGLAVSAWHSSNFVYWVMDLSPDVALAIGLVRPSAASARLLDWLNRQVLRRAHTIIVMDQPMARRLAAKGEMRAKLLTIPPWGGPIQDAPNTMSGSGFRVEHGLERRFVVMYSGNHNMVHPLGALLDAAERLQHDPIFAFVFVGGGQGKTEVEARRLPNVHSLPYQPRNALADSLGAADLHVVVMGNEMVGIVHPSKIYGVLAVGRPVLYIGPADCHVASIVERHNLGWSVRNGDVDGAVEALRRAAAESQTKRAARGTRARNVLDRDYPPALLMERVADVVSGAIAR
jgi:putative colanic acid biosynthesis glycosyltransferase WcaI